MVIREKEWLLLFVFIFTCLLFIPGKGEAYVFGSSDMELSNLIFFVDTITDPNAELVWTDVWYGEVYADADDSDSPLQVPEFYNFLGNNGSISVTRDTAHVESNATYSVTSAEEEVMVDGESIFIPIGLPTPILASTHSDIELNNVAGGEGEADAYFDNFFVISGGDPGDHVEVTFTLDYTGQLTGNADDLGYFEIALGAYIALANENYNTIDECTIYQENSGSNFYFQQNYPGMLSISTTLQYDKEYWFFAEAYSEVYATNAPEPATILLLGSGLLGLAKFRKKFRKA